MENGFYEKFIKASTMTGVVVGSFYGANVRRENADESLYNTIINSCLCGAIGIPVGLVIGIASPIVVPVITVSTLIGMSMHGFYKLRNELIKPEKSQNSDCIDV